MSCEAEQSSALQRAAACSLTGNSSCMFSVGFLSPPQGSETIKIHATNTRRTGRAHQQQSVSAGCGREVHMKVSLLQGTNIVTDKATAVFEIWCGVGLSSNNRPTRTVPTYWEKVENTCPSPAHQSHQPENFWLQKGLPAPIE